MPMAWFYLSSRVDNGTVTWPPSRRTSKMWAVCVQGSLSILMAAYDVRIANHRSIAVGKVSTLTITPFQKEQVVDGLIPALCGDGDEGTIRIWI